VPFRFADTAATNTDALDSSERPSNTDLINDQKLRDSQDFEWVVRKVHVIRLSHGSSLDRRLAATGDLLTGLYSRVFAPSSVN
jgi:hypothetical protein